MAQVKGSNLLGAVKFLRRHKDAARAELAPGFHRYLEDRVLQTEWYPEADLVELLRVIAKLIGNAGPDAFALMGRATLREHVTGVYERLLKGDESNLARRIGAIWQTQHDTGRFKFELTGRGRGRFDLEEFAHPSREMCAIITGYLAEALATADFPNARVTKVGCVLDGHKTCRWEGTWLEAGRS